ncbi:ImmA/IrrE family metallo-endopeptidase [Listeria sp. ILCC792]|uniref:spr1629 family repressor/antitoxin n=1 Tax=Listeria sp. ILCC792 TaxID=1918331 RepID=UPI000B58BAFF|nr:XRE family transcriptional regulator [Listeria sp. ILCC792]
MFRGDNLQRVRALYGLSRKELGEKLGVSEQAVWQFENQVTNPKFEIVVELKRLFGVKTQFFLQELKVPSVFKEEQIIYRAADMTSRKRAFSETEYLNFVHEVITSLESFLSSPKSTILSLREKCLKMYYQRSESKNCIEEIAALAKEFIGVTDDNANLLLQLEKSGIHIVEKDVGDKTDAYSAWSASQIPIIVLGIKKSAVRRNFDLAHELGHLLMHNNIDMLALDKEDYNKIENEANLFAACFLLPKKNIVKDLQELRHISNPDSYMELKAKYNVSIQALEMRAYRLGFLTPQQNSYFYRQLAKKKYKFVEPLDSEIPLKRPGKIRNILELILSNQVISLAELETMFKVETLFLERLFTIEPAFFEKYQAKEDFSSYNNVLKPKFR